MLAALKWRYISCMLESLTESLTESLRKSLGSGDDIKSTNLPSNFFFELDFIRETCYYPCTKILPTHKMLLNSIEI